MLAILIVAVSRRGVRMGAWELFCEIFVRRAYARTIVGSLKFDVAHNHNLWRLLWRSDVAGRCGVRGEGRVCHPHTRPHKPRIV